MLEVIQQVSDRNGFKLGSLASDPTNVDVLPCSDEQNGSFPQGGKGRGGEALLTAKHNLSGLSK